MNQNPKPCKHIIDTALCIVLLLPACVSQAVTIVFFDISQTTNLVVASATSDTMFTEGYVFTYTRDKLFTGNLGGGPIGRTERVHWPAGLEAQAVTEGPTLSKATIEVMRQDGQPFAITSFTGKLLANTGGAGGSFEVMPRLGDTEPKDPFAYMASGNAGNQFTYQTPELSGYDRYTFTLYVDFALMSLTVVDADPPRPSIEALPLAGVGFQLSWPASATGYTLYSSTNLNAAVWEPVTNAVANDGQVCTVTIETKGSHGMFRLQQ